MHKPQFQYFLIGNVITIDRMLPNGNRAGIKNGRSGALIDPSVTLVPSVITVPLATPREPQTFFLGEVVDGVQHVTTHKEVPFDPLTVGLVSIRGGIPFQVIPGEEPIMHWHIPPGYGLMPALLPVRSNRDGWRHFIVGDLWEGEPWLHAVKEMPLPQMEPTGRAGEPN